MATTLFINGSDRTPAFYIGAVTIEERLGSRGTMRADMYYTESWRPYHMMEAVLTVDGTTLFAGPILGKQETLINPLTGLLKGTITVADYAHYCDRMITGVVEWAPGGGPSGNWTLRDIAQDIVTRWLGPSSPPTYFNIDLDPTAFDDILPNGPTFTYMIKAEWVTPTDVLNNLTALTGFVWKINSSKQLQFRKPTGTAFPVNLTETNVLAGLTVSEEFTDYCNTVYVLSKGPTTTFLEDLDQMGDYNRWQRFINAPEIETAAEAQSLAQGTLDKYGFLPKIVNCQTRVLGFHPGQTGTITLPIHDLVAADHTNEFVIQAVTYKHLVTQPGTGGTDADRWICEIEALGGNTRTGGLNWVDQWQGIVSGGGSSSASQSSMSVAGATYNITISGFSDFQAYLGGSRNVGLQWSGSYSPVPGYVDVKIDGAKYSGLTVKARVWVRTDAATTSVTPRIVRVSDNVAVGTGTAATNTAWENTPQEISLTLSAGVEQYRLELMGSNINAAIYAIGVLYVV